jgi:hypothetical protein
MMFASKKIAHKNTSAAERAAQFHCAAHPGWSKVIIGLFGGLPGFF